jgi:hypothetical protein
MNKKIIAAIACLSLFALMFAGCAPDNNTNDLDNGENTASETYPAPDITGEILDVTNDGALRVLVDSKTEMVSGEIWVTIEDDTVFIDPQGSTFEPEDAKSLFTAGDSVSFLSTGEIMESYPMQTGAQNVYLNE